MNSAVVERIYGGFPSNQYLEVNATVVEIVTSKEEGAVDSSLKFSDHAVYLDFSSSRKTFRPSIDYTLKVMGLK